MGVSRETVGFPPPFQPALSWPTQASWSAFFPPSQDFTQLQLGKRCPAGKAFGSPGLPLGRLWKDPADQPEPIPLAREMPGGLGRAKVDPFLWAANALAKTFHGGIAGQTDPGKRARLAGLQCQE